MSEPDPRLIKYLVGRDANCVGCGYNLRGCASVRCPECGRAIRSGDFLPRPGWRWLLLAFAWMPFATYAAILGAWIVGGDLERGLLGFALLFVFSALVGASLATYLCVRLVSIPSFYTLFTCMFVSLCIAVLPIMLWLAFFVVWGRGLV